jgi:hypothetical protein
MHETEEQLNHKTGYVLGTYEVPATMEMVNICKAIVAQRNRTQAAGEVNRATSNTAPTRTEAPAAVSPKRSAAP